MSQEEVKKSSVPVRYLDYEVGCREYRKAYFKGNLHTLKRFSDLN